MPMIDVPVSLIGTFAVMAALGFSLNNVSLLGLVLAIGIVVDDAIVVVENVERWMAMGLSPKEATVKAVDEITGPVIAITLVLSSVFLPAAFIPGISGQFYRQFALTIATSMVISAINALTMAPARAPQLLRAHSGDHHDKGEALPPPAIVLIVGFIVYAWATPTIAHLFGVSLPAGHGEGVEHASSAAVVWSLRLAVFAAGSGIGWLVAPSINRVLGSFFRAFNRVFDRITNAYGRLVKSLMRISAVIMVVYLGLLGLTYLGFTTVPTGFIPEQDKGYLVVNAQLPDGASLERTEAVMAKVDEIAHRTPGVLHTISLPGYSILTANNISNVGGMYVILDPFEERIPHHQMAATILAELRRSFRSILEAQVVAFGAPPVEGLGSTGGFKMQIQDRTDAGLVALQGAVANVIEKGNAQPGLVGLFSSFQGEVPRRQPK
jgi:multidrug efflux pump subunit AcrB